MLRIPLYAEDSTLTAESGEPLGEGERGEWRSWLKTRHSKTKVIASSTITSWQVDWDKVEEVTDFIFLGFKITMDDDCSHEIKRHLLLGIEAMYDKPRQHIKKQRHHFVDKGLSSQSYGFSSSHVWMWQLDYKGGWVSKKRCFQIMVLEKTLESPLDSKEIKPVNPKGNQPWIFIGRTDAEAPILCPPDAKNCLTGKDPDAGKDWRQKGEGISRWDGWMATPTQWTWIWANSGR